MAQNLWFNYTDNAKIRFKKINCLEHPDYPKVYRIRTEHLDFMVPKPMTIIGKTHVFIPLDYYRSVLTKHWLPKTI